MEKIYYSQLIRSCRGVLTSAFRPCQSSAGILTKRFSHNWKLPCSRLYSVLSPSEDVGDCKRIGTPTSNECDSELSSKVDIKLKNRNPRNPEHFGWNKPRGYKSSYRRRDFYCRLNMLITNRHIKANVEHHTGRVLVAASTSEFLIAKHLYKTTDTSAAFNIGRVLRQRCLEAGITKMLWDPKRDRGRLRLQALKRGFTGGIISLSEPKRKVFPEQVLADGVYNKKKKPLPFTRKTRREKSGWYV